MSAKAVKYVVEHVAYWSRNGHHERACTVTRTSDGKRISCVHDGESTVTSGLAVVCGKGASGFPAILSVRTADLNAREFRAFIDGLPYFKGSHETMAKQIRKAFRNK